MPETHILVSARGGYASGSNQDEIWAMNMRYALVWGTVDNKGTFPSNLQVLDDAQETDNAQYNYRSNFAVTAGTLPFNLEDWVTGSLLDGWTSFWAGGAQAATACQLRELVIAPIEAPFGRASERRSARLTWKTPIPGSGGANMLPTEVATVVSWQTDRLGPKGKGRIYLPARTVTGTHPEGYMNVGTAGVLLDGAVDLLETTQYDGIGPNQWNARPVVTGKPYREYATVTGVRVGRIYDAQRRRRNALDENYVSKQVSY